MAQLRSTAVRRGSKNDCDKDEGEIENNGYVPGFAKPLEQDNQNIVLSWLRVMISSMSSSQQRTILAALVGASVFLLGIVGYFDVGELFRRLCGLIIPTLCVLSVFYWIALYLRKTWHATSIYIFFCSCYAGEFFGQCFASASHDITHPFLVIWVLSCICLASVFSSLQTCHSCIVICSMSLTRLISCTSLVDLPQCLRPYVNYSAGLIGVIIAKYTETLVRPRVNSLIMHDGKIPVIKRRRSSSSSAHGFAAHSHRSGRRTSLPALSQKSQSSSGYESALLGEAHGLITDMLADSTLPPHVVSGLRALGTLLKPPENHSAVSKPPRISPLVSLTETSNYGSDTEDSPYTGERPSSLPKRLRRSLPPSLIRRMSTSTWTTTTSATGMPTLEPEPCRTRSSSFRYSRDTTPGASPNNSRSNSPSPMSPTAAAVSLTIPKSRSFSIATTHVSQNQKWTMPGRRSLFTPNHHSHQELGEKKPVSPLVKEVDGDGSDRTSRPTGASPLAKRLNITSDYESNDSPSSSDLSDGHVTLEEGSKRKMAQEGVVERITGVTIDDTDSSEVSNQAVKVVKLPYDLTQFENIELLQKNRLCEWDYPIFTLSSQLGDNILSQVTYRIFIETGLFETFRIPLPEFMNYFNALEMGYRDKPYHNRVHATDVLHGVYFLATQPVPGFTQIDPENDLFTKHSSSSDSDADASDRPSVIHRPSFTADDSYGIVGGNFPPIELMAMFTSAAMHDYDHPGRTNAFLVATNAPLAVLYNDRSVLESHHAASAWSLVLSDPKYNWLCHLDKAEFKRFRYLVIEAILATDLKRHFEFLAEFNAKVNDDDAPGIDWFSETDRLLVSQMAIKLADINGPCKRRDLHTSWTARISDEFYEQGDEENALGLPISPYMDRNRPQLAKLQESFINHLVAPLCNSYASAGLLPGTWVEADDDGDASGSESDAGDSSPSCKDTEDDSPMAPKSPLKAKRKSKKIFCHLTKNLKDNHTMWVARIKEEEMQREMSSVKKKEGEATEIGDNKEEMSPIEEVNESATGDGCKDCERNQQQSEPVPSGSSIDCTELVKSKPDAKPAVEDWGVKPKINRKKSQTSNTNSNASSKSTDSTADNKSQASSTCRKSSESSDSSTAEVSVSDMSVTQEPNVSVKSSKECASLDSHNNNVGSRNKTRALNSDNSGLCESHQPKSTEISSKTSDT